MVMEEEDEDENRLSICGRLSLGAMWVLVGSRDANRRCESQIEWNSVKRYACIRRCQARHDLGASNVETCKIKGAQN